MLRDAAKCYEKGPSRVSVKHVGSEGSTSCNVPRYDALNCASY